MSKTKSDLKTAGKKATLTALIAPIIYLALGVIMIVWPDMVGVALCYILGSALTLYGLINIISFFVTRGFNMYFEMLVGILALAFGIFTLVSPYTVVNILFSILGILIIIDSFIDIKRSFDLKYFGFSGWWLSFVLSLIVVILGIIAVFFPSFFGDFILILLGIMLVYEGISGIAIIILLKRFSKKLEKQADMIEAEAEDIN